MKTRRHRIWQMLAASAMTLLFPWTVLALWFDVRTPGLRIVTVILYLGVVAALLGWIHGGWWRWGGWLLLNTLVVLWWLQLKPPADQPWAPEFARQPWAERVGDRVTIHDVRNFDYRSENDFTVIWEKRTVDPREILGADLFLTHWGVPLIAHSIVSFRFADGTYLATSIEARRTTTQPFSALRGFFRQFTVIFLIADERDVVRVRTNYRKNEKVYLYRTRLNAEDARGLFEAYLGWMNEARAHPEWYNALTKNCSTPLTSYLSRKKFGGVARWDWRGVLDGSGDEMLYQLGDLAGDSLPFEDLKKQALINPVAQAADQAKNFSQLIREQRAGFEP